MADQSELKSALRTLKILANGLAALPELVRGEMSEDFCRAVKACRAAKGRVIVTGVGKSGHIGSKIAATLASTGTPAHFVHSSEANHGDLGMITKDDVILGLSWSGETAELKGILAYAKRFSIPLIALTRSRTSTLGKQANICLALPKMEEACPNKLAPTTSTMMQLAIGDALAIALLEAKGFSANDFKTFHPGGSLGANLTRVSEIMHQGDRLPIVQSNTKMEEAIATISQKGFGCVIVVNGDQKLAGIITDGDLRRHFSKSITGMKAGDIMTKNPVTIGPNTLVSSAMAILDEKPITSLIVCEDEKPIGLVHLHDLLRIGAA